MCHGVARAKKTALLRAGCSWRRRGEGAARASRDEEGDADDGDGKDDTDQAFGQDVQGAGGGEEQAGRAGRGGLLLGLPEREEGGGEEDADGEVRDVDAGEDEDAEAGEGDEACVEAGLLLVWFAELRGGSAGEELSEEREGQDGEGQGQAGCCGGRAEDLDGCGFRPVVEGGFFQVADAVGVKGDGVVAEEHLAGDLGVDGVGVVEERWGEEGEGGVEDEPEGEEDEAVGAEVGGGGHVLRVHGGWWSDLLDPFIAMLPR